MADGRLACVQVWLAAAADSGGDLSAHGGNYYDSLALATPNALTEDAALALRLWETTERLSGVQMAF